MEEFLVRLAPARPEMLTEGPTDGEAEAVAAHFEYLKAMHARGRLVIAGRTRIEDERTFGIAVFLARDEREAWDVAAADPAIVRGVFRAEVFPFRTALLAGRD